MHTMSSGDLYHAESYLDFKNLHLCGREKDIQVLNQAYEQSSFNSSPQIVWLKGNPGVGKSALVEHLFLPKDNYCSGKFDRLRTSVPYSALTQLLTKLAYVLEFDGKVISSLSEDDELILSHLVPEISLVLKKKKSFRGNTDNPQDSAAAAAAASVSCSLEWGLERLKQALRTFLMAVCNALESPLIMFLDDLQWADLDTLEILKDLLVAEEEENQEGEEGTNATLLTALMSLIITSIIRAQNLINYLRKLRIRSVNQNLIKDYLEIRIPAKLMRLIPVIKGNLTTGLISSGA